MTRPKHIQDRVDAANAHIHALIKKAGGIDAYLEKFHRPQDRASYRPLLQEIMDAN